MIKNRNINEIEEKVRKWKEHIQKYTDLNQHGVSGEQEKPNSAKAPILRGGGRYSRACSWTGRQRLELEVTTVYVKKLDHFVVHTDIKL